MMKNSEIHNLFSQGDIRDFLAMSMVKSYDADNKNNKEFPPRCEDAFEHAIAIAKADIKYLERYVENLSVKQAIIKLIELNGWEEHDVSDYTVKDIGYNLWMNFIGTEDEFKELMERINKSK